MTTTGVLDVSVPVRDRDAAPAFDTEVLGCEVRMDAEIWPRARMIEVVPPGPTVGIVLLPPDSRIPNAVRPAPRTPRPRTRASARRVALGNDEVLHMDGAPPMFSFTDPDGNGLVYPEEFDR